MPVRKSLNESCRVYIESSHRYLYRLPDRRACLKLKCDRYEWLRLKIRLRKLDRAILDQVREVK